MVLIDKDVCADIYKDRPENSHKGTFGKLLAVCGSKNYSGAAGLVALGALRSGVGIFKLASECDVCNRVGAFFLEPTFAPYPDRNQLLSDIDSLLSDCNAIVCGCGLGRDSISIDIVKKILEKSSKPLVLDADGIIALKEHINMLKVLSCPLVLTPHPKEMAYLTEQSVSNVVNDSVLVAGKFSQKNNCITLLKGSKTVIADENGDVYILDMPNSGLAKGGSGDLLSGIIGSLLAQGYSPLNAAILGAYIHSSGAKLCADRMGKESMLPSDIPFYFKEVFDCLKGV